MIDGREDKRNKGFKWLEQQRRKTMIDSYFVNSAILMDQ